MTSIAIETRRAPSATSDLLAATGRVLLAAIFVLSGVSKLADPTGTIAYITSAGLPAPSLAYGVAVAVELVGGLLLSRVATDPQRSDAMLRAVKAGLGVAPAARAGQSAHDHNAGESA